MLILVINKRRVLLCTPKSRIESCAWLLVQGSSFKVPVSRPLFRGGSLRLERYRVLSRLSLYGSLNLRTSESLDPSAPETKAPERPSLFRARTQASHAMDVADSAGLSSHYPLGFRPSTFADWVASDGVAFDRVAFCAMRVSPQLPPIPILARDGETLTLEDIAWLEALPPVRVASSSRRMRLRLRTHLISPGERWIALVSNENCRPLRLRGRDLRDRAALTLRLSPTNLLGHGSSRMRTPCQGCLIAKLGRRIACPLRDPSFEEALLVEGSFERVASFEAPLSKELFAPADPSGSWSTFWEDV